MNIVINDLYRDNFIHHLMRQYKKYILADIDKNKIKLYDDYFENVLNLKIKCINYIVKALDNLQFIRTKDSIILYINNNIYINNINVLDVCKLINYGNREIQAYPIFSKWASYIKNNLEDIYLEYRKGWLLYE